MRIFIAIIYNSNSVIKGDVTMVKFLGLFKKIFSRLFAVALTVILQVAIIVYFAFELTNKYIYFQVISSIIGILVFVGIINKRIHPEHKLMWAFLMLLIPVFGVTLFILLEVNKPSKKRIKKYTTFDMSTAITASPARWESTSGL